MVLISLLTDFDLDKGNIDVDYEELGDPEDLLRFDEDKAVHAHGKRVMSTSVEVNPAFMAFFMRRNQSGVHVNPKGNHRDYSADRVTHGTKEEKPLMENILHPDKTDKKSVDFDAGVGIHLFSYCIQKDANGGAKIVTSEEGSAVNLGRRMLRTNHVVSVEGNDRKRYLYMEGACANELDAATFTKLCRLFNVKRKEADAPPCSAEISAFFEMFSTVDLQSMEGIKQFLENLCFDKFFKVTYYDPMDFHWKFTKFIQRQTTYGHYPLEGQHRSIPCSDLASGIFTQDRRAFKVIEENVITRQEHVEGVVKRVDFSPIYKKCVYSMCTPVKTDGHVFAKNITELSSDEYAKVTAQFETSLSAYLLAGMTSQDAAAKTIDPEWNDLILSATIGTMRNIDYQTLNFSNFWDCKLDKDKRYSMAWQYNQNGEVVVISLRKAFKKMTPLLRKYEGMSTISISQAEETMIDIIKQAKGSNLWCTGTKIVKYKDGVPSATIGPMATLIHHCSLAEASMSMLEEFCRSTIAEVAIKQREPKKAENICRYIQFDGHFLTQIVIRTAEFAKDQVIRSLQQQYETRSDILDTLPLEKRKGTKDFRAYWLRRVSIALVCSMTYDIMSTFIHYGMNPEVVAGKSDEFLNYVK